MDEGRKILAMDLPRYGWKVRLDHEFPEKRDQNLRPSLKQLFDVLPMIFRFIPLWIKKFWAGHKPVIDFLKPVTGQNIYGVPLGGIGCGTIGRGFKGEFCRYQLKPGLYEYHTVTANQFIVAVADEDGNVWQRVLSPSKAPEGSLSAWEWELPGEDAEYCGLYPRSWTSYTLAGGSGLKLQCRQVSPVIPHNYKDSSLPVAVFIWTLENHGSHTLDVSITFTFKNGNGTMEDEKGGCWSEAFQEESAVGTLIHQDIGGMKCVYGVAGLQKDGVQVSRSLRFDPCSDGKQFWEDLKDKRRLDLETAGRSATTEQGQQLATAVSLRTVVAAHEQRVLELALAWDMPHVSFSGRRSQFSRYYTRFFGDGGDAAPRLCEYALSNYGRWEEEIDAWQSPVLQDTELPDWYKSALFNELYFVSDGGSVWFLPSGSSPTGDARDEVGVFGYLEGHEYRMYNTYDVHFYASFALAMLWPRLQLSLQYQLMDAFRLEDSSSRSHLYDGRVGRRKVRDTVPHDMGDPEEDPFLLVNAYPIHDVSQWRDLNLKFVLQSFRDFALMGDRDYLLHAWPTIKIIVAQALLWDRDGDGLIENSGSPDQTYDTWVMQGPSAYCGGLWVATLFCAAQMAEIVGDAAARLEYRQLLERARLAFQQKLWNGEYYNFDCSSGDSSRSIMADQLCGHWYLRASGVTEEVFPREHVAAALSKIYHFNVVGFSGGEMGAVNGMLPSGAVDRSSLQSEEVWTGVVYALAALMIHEGMEQEGFRTAEGVYRTVYERIGMGFETPEALLQRRCYRSVGYMRPLSIWAMQLAWQQRRRHL